MTPLTQFTVTATYLTNPLYSNPATIFAKSTSFPNLIPIGDLLTSRNNQHFTKTPHIRPLPNTTIVGITTENTQLMDIMIIPSPTTVKDVTVTTVTLVKAIQIVCIITIHTLFIGYIQTPPHITLLKLIQFTL